METTLVSAPHAAEVSSLCEQLITVNLEMQGKVEELKGAQKRLLEYRKVIECTRDMIYVFGRDCRYLLANEAYLECRRSLFPDLIGRSLREVIGEETFREIREKIEECFDGREVSYETTYCYPDKGTRDLLVTFTPIDEGDRVDRVACLIKDITERKELEEQLRQSQKMEAIGTLAGGIAHDFNNILTVISGYACLIQINNEGSEAASLAAEISESVHRAAEMTRGLLAFSRKQEVHLAPLDLNRVVADLHKSLTRLISEEVELVVRLGSAPLCTLADRGQLEQVLINLAVNARDAMPSGGTLEIRIEEVELDPEEAEEGEERQLQRYGMITVTDSGTGISTELQSRVFEPFFTTKEVGKGTGLGLSTCYGIIKKHGGVIRMQSEPGAGTSFRIYLPLIVPPPAEGSAETCCDRTTGTETVLLVEDDETVRTMTRMLLEHHGYTVFAAKEGEEAMRLFLERRQEIELLITDVVMPRLNGRELSRQIQRLSPGLPTIFISGYPADVMSQQGLVESVSYLPKPIKAELLLSRIREVLAERQLHLPLPL